MIKFFISIFKVFIILAIIFGAIFLFFQYGANQDFISGFGNSNPQSVLDDFVKIVKNQDGDNKLTESESQKLEDLGSGASFPLFNSVEDFGIKNAAENFKKLNFIKPLNSWEIISQNDETAEGVLNFVNTENSEDISTAKIFLKKENHLGFYPRWQIEIIQTPEDLGACFALLSQPANKLIPCFVQRIKEFPGLFRQFAYIIRQFYDENLAPYITFRFSSSPFN